MNHWSTAWLGRPFVPGTYECGDFVREVLEAHFGRRVALPRPASATQRDRDRLIEDCVGVLAAPTDTPAEGDAVLMRGLGRLTGIGHHIGLYALPAGRPHVLHCMRGAGSCLHEIASLPVRRLEYVGAYRWL